MTFEEAYQKAQELIAQGAIPTKLECKDGEWDLTASFGKPQIVPAASEETPYMTFEQACSIARAMMSRHWDVRDIEDEHEGYTKGVWYTISARPPGGDYWWFASIIDAADLDHTERHPKVSAA